MKQDFMSCFIFYIMLESNKGCVFMHFSLDISDYKMSLREYYKYRYKSWLIASIVIFIFGILFLISSIVDYDVQKL